MNFEEETRKTKIKIITITVLVVFGFLFFLVFLPLFLVNSFFSSTTTTTYYVLKIDEENKEKVRSLLKQERPHMSLGKNDFTSCDMEKIEYYTMFPDGTSYTLYCKNQKDISFGIDKVGEDVLKSYIYENGTKERK